MNAKRRTASGYMARPEKMKRPAPEFSITEKELPAIKDWKVGTKYSMELEVEMVTASKGSDMDTMMGEKSVHSARFKILSVDSEPEGEEESESENEKD